MIVVCMCPAQVIWFRRGCGDQGAPAATWRGQVEYWRCHKACADYVTTGGLTTVITPRTLAVYLHGGQGRGLEGAGGFGTDRDGCEGQGRIELVELIRLIRIF